VEADELSYCLHIVLRYELELALLEQEMPVEELPQQWNRRMQDLLGIQPRTDSEGCLQDIHWAEGLLGYFPSYALGHLISASFRRRLSKPMVRIETLISAGDELKLQAWLGQTVWPLGRSVNAEELVGIVTGRPLSAQPSLAYLRKKVAELSSMG
jgi:carboxypeptidase Taq